MNILKVYVENEMYVLSSDHLKNIEGSRLERAVLKKEIFPKILVISESESITNVYLDTSLKVWDQIKKIIKISDKEDQKSKYFTSLYDITDNTEAVYIDELSKYIPDDLNNKKDLDELENELTILLDDLKSKNIDNTLHYPKENPSREKQSTEEVFNINQIAEISSNREFSMAIKNQQEELLKDDSSVDSLNLDI